MYSPRLRKVIDAGGFQQVANQVRLFCNINYLVLW